MLNWTWTQFWAANRNIGSFVAGVMLGTMVTLWFVDINVEGLVKVIIAVTGLVTAAAPIYNALSAARSASPANQAASVAENIDKVESTETRNQLINTVSEMPEVNKIIAQPQVARETESPKVVAL